MSHYAMTIDGAPCGSTDDFGVINPATEEEIARAPSCSSAQLDDAVASAKRAFAHFRRDEAARRDALRKAGELLEASANDVARTLTLEQGKPLSHATAEVLGSAAQLKSAANLPIPHEVTRDDAKGRIEICYRPFGVVAAITPWNYPILIATSKIAPALLAGNTVVLKPSPFTPLSTLALGAVLNRALPKGVLNVVSGGNDLGAWLTAHPDVKKISFTGSVATGKRVGQTAAADLKRVTLELGGNDPAIVLDDADPESVALSLFWSAFTNSGQICTAVKRVYAPESVYEPLVAALAKIAREVKVGDGLDPDSQLGPINNPMQLERVAGLVEDARRRGATMRAGGARLPRKGYFYAPTIVTGAGDDVPVVNEEQFGPVLPVLPYRALDDAIERANATHFGLGASVWSKSLERARRVADELEAGTVWINQHLALTALAPFAGAKWSGVGEAGGRWGLASFMQKHVVNQRIS
ncbi:MAG TPA: aldehyde dehydrogenase family protein [Polyangiaceae bacterium]|nr:aldehyde dehydrogenase family protein [Polyangiaceae bacterium]